MSDRSYLDWPFYDDTHRQLAQDVRAWADRNVEQITEQNLSLDETCRALVDAMGRDGLTKHSVTAPFGGHHETLDVRSLCLIRETLAQYSGLADFSFAMQGLGSGPLVLFGTEAQKQEYLPPVAAGAAVSAFALTEPEAGSDVARLAMTAELDGNHYALNGRKTWISNGGIADQYVVFARTGEAPGAKGISAFIVPADTAGLKVEERIDVIAPHPLATLHFDHCRLPADAMIGAPGEGFKIAMATLDVFRTTVGAAALGFARRALDDALRHISNREISGTPMTELQMVQSKIAEMATSIDAAALLIARSAWTKDMGAARVSREASMAKMFATEQAQIVIDEAVQLFGGLGVKIGVKVEELYREIRALRIYEGATDVQKIIIARQTFAAQD